LGAVAISNQQSAFSIQHSAFSIQHSANRECNCAAREILRGSNRSGRRQHLSAAAREAQPSAISSQHSAFSIQSLESVIALHAKSFGSKPLRMTRTLLEWGSLVQTTVVLCAS